MRAIILVYQLQEDEYPTLTSLPKETLEYYLRRSYTNLDAADREDVKDEDMLEHPVDVIIVG